MPSDPPCCEHYGILGGTAVTLPADPSVLGDESKLVGCNRLFCVTCRSWVRHIDDAGLANDTHELEKLYVDARAHPALAAARGHRVYTCRCTCVDVASTTRNRMPNADGWRCAGHPHGPCAGGAESFHLAAGARATRTVPDLDSVERELAAFVRESVRWLDPAFPRHGTRGPKARGQWTDEAKVVTLMQQVEEFDADGRGLRFIRTTTLDTPGGPHEGAHRVTAVGLVDGLKLELWWSVIASANDVRGTSIELAVAGANGHECIADFRAWFGQAAPSPPVEEDDRSDIPWQLLT